MKKFQVKNIAERDMLEMYCVGKGWLWNRFWGCRAYVRDEKTGDLKYSIYAVPLKVYCEVVIRVRKWESAENIDISVKENEKNA